jgi:hypothetical protein
LLILSSAVFEHQLDHSFALSGEYAFGRRKYAFNTIPDTSIKCSRNVIGRSDVHDE